MLARAPQFAEALTVATVDLQAAMTARLRDTRLRPPVRRALPEVRQLGSLARREDVGDDMPGGDVAPLLEPEAEVYAALVARHARLRREERLQARRDRAVGRDRLHARAADRRRRARARLRDAVTMPSRYSSSGTRDDAKVLADNLGVELHEIADRAGDGDLRRPAGPQFEGRDPDITEENLQARIRGNLLMALSNKFGWLVLTTGNKSENAVGYSTLYGDSAGGFAVIKDVPKTLVYRLVDFRNARDADHPVPRSIIDRPPSAELREDQRDADSLPDYDTLDAILEAYIEEDADPDQLERAGFPREAVEKVIALVDRAEYKRRQAPPGIKITPRAFGRDRRMPITNAYRPRRRPVVL